MTIISVAPTGISPGRPFTPTSGLLGGLGNAKQLSQFYTIVPVARHCLNVFYGYCDPCKHLLVEPSAGRGAFSDSMPADRIAIDIEPKGRGIIKANFLDLQISSSRPIAMVGNLPFGQQSRTAVAMFNHAARQSVMLGFILPNTFRKASIVNDLDRHYHLVHDEPVPSRAFIFQGQPRTVPTAFQVWERRDYERPLILEQTEHADFRFVDATQANFALNRVGAQAGQVHKHFGKSPRSTYFIDGEVEHVMRRLEPAFRAAAANTAGNPSLARSEVVALYRAHTGR